MTSTQAPRRTVFRTIAQTLYYEWPASDSTPLYDRCSLGALTNNIRTIAAVWFGYDAYESVKRFFGGSHERILNSPLQHLGDPDPTSVSRHTSVNDW